jgi:type II secretory pathway component GspD/PulD (secretin)
MPRTSITLALILLLSLAPHAQAQAAAPISLDIRDLDIYDAVRLLTTQAEVNLVLDASVEHRPITLRLQRVAFEEALATLAQMSDLEAVRIGNIIYLGTPEAINRRYPTVSPIGSRTRAFVLKNAPAETLAKQLADALPRGTIIASDRRTSTILVTATPLVLARAEALVRAFDRATDFQSAALPMRFVKASDALRALQATFPIVAPASAYAADQQNAIIVGGPADFIAQAGDVLRNIDRPGRQVRYEVRVTDISPSDTSNVGLLFGGLALNGQPSPGQTSTSFVSNSVAINATLNALVTRGRASILAQPSLSTLNNVQASLLVGQQFPLVYFDARTGTQQVQFANVGVNLSVSPTIGADGAITTELETDYSTIVNFVNNFPVIGTRKAQSTLRVRDGETIVIAGLFQDIDASSVSKVPFLGDLPIVGEVFKNRQRSSAKDEIIFLITPHLVADLDVAPPARN